MGAFSLALIGINLPFMLHVERIGRQSLASAAASSLTLWLYLGLLFGLYLRTTALKDQSIVLGIVLGLVAGIALWLLLGGQYLLRHRRRAEPVPQA